jgi:hypothetical protein
MKATFTAESYSKVPASTIITFHHGRLEESGEIPEPEERMNGDDYENRG